MPVFNRPLRISVLADLSWRAGINSGMYSLFISAVVVLVELENDFFSLWESARQIADISVC